MIDMLLIATGNKGKLQEISLSLKGIVKEVKTLDDFPLCKVAEETGNTFTENAVFKAEFVFEQTGIMTLADDSGLEVNALKGQPGIFSARYAGEQAGDDENNKKLLAMLHNVPTEKRSARFTCVLALASAERTQTFRGTVKGFIAHSPQGSGGFGYDPMFIPAGHDKTFGELGEQVKNSMSHRTSALNKLKNYLDARIRQSGEF